MRNQGIKEFDGKEFLARKTGKENKELTSLKIRFFLYFWEGKKGLIFIIQNIASMIDNI